MTRLIVRIEPDVTAMESAFAKIAEGSPELIQAVFGALDAGEELFTIRRGDGDAAPAIILRVTFEPSDRLRGLMAAFGTGN